jgi:hypothetical protein
VCGYGTIAIHFFLEDEGGWIFHQGMKSPKWLNKHAVGPWDIVGSQFLEGICHRFSGASDCWVGVTETTMVEPKELWANEGKQGSEEVESQ